MSRPTRAVPAASGVSNVHHEGPAIDTFRTLLWAAVVVATVVLSCAASRAIYSRLMRPASDRSSTPLHGEGLILPAEPRLEGIEMMSLNDAAASAADEDRLQTYGWVDREKKTVHIPIQRAMELAIERGWLRTATPTTEDSSKRTDKPKTSSENHSAR